MNIALDERSQQVVGDRIRPLVTCPQMYAQKLVGHKFFVELVSKQVHLQDDRAVPVGTQDLDVVVIEPTLQAIEQLLAGSGWLKDWQIVSYSKPKAHEAPF